MSSEKRDSEEAKHTCRTGDRIVYDCPVPGCGNGALKPEVPPCPHGHATHLVGDGVPCTAEAPLLGRADALDAQLAGLNKGVDWEEAVKTAFLSAVHRGDPCPFCRHRTDNVWPFCVHFKEVCVVPKLPGWDVDENMLRPSDAEPESPNFVSQAAKDLAARDFVRVNEPRTTEAQPVSVRDMGGDGTGPWRLFIGEYGVADWPCTHDPNKYAHVVAESVRSALRIWGRSRASANEYDAGYARGREMGHTEGFAEGQASMTERGQEVQLDEARRVIASLRAELEEVKVDRDSADQALDRERAREPETFAELQARSLRESAGKAQTVATNLEDCTCGYRPGTGMTGHAWDCAIAPARVAAAARGRAFIGEPGPRQATTAKRTEGSKPCQQESSPSSSPGASSPRRSEASSPPGGVTVAADNAPHAPVCPYCFMQGTHTYSCRLRTTPYVTPTPSPTEAMMAALEAWDYLFVWSEPFEGYAEEKALHNAFVALKASEGAAAHSPKETP